MKKFLMYVVVLVAVLFIGYTTYYFLKNNEDIQLALAEGEAIYINKDKTCDLPIVWVKPYNSTVLNIAISDQNIVSYDADNKKFIAKAGGNAQITITPSNEEFGPFRFDIYVGDGSIMYPYYIQTEDELLSIGTVAGTKWQLSHSYTVVKDLDFVSVENFTPIGTETTPFSGTFNGNGKIISNLKISTAENAGLFGAIGQTGVVENVVLVNPVISGSFKNAGAISAISNGVIRLCDVQGLNLVNIQENSNNGGIVGKVTNSSFNNIFSGFGYIEMCSVSVTAETAGNFGGICGTMIGSVVYNCKSEINKFTELSNSLSKRRAHEV